MGYPSDRFAPAFFLPLLAWAIPGAALAQEIPLAHCDTLPLIEVKVGEHPRWFLVDTAATAMLNLESFAEGSSRDIRVTSWSGTLSTSAKEVRIEDLEVGRTKIAELALPAIDLSAIGKACGRKIDGILGADLLEKIGATVDLRRQILHVTTADEVHEAQLASEIERDTERCTKAFNESDEKTFGDCLDPKVVMFTSKEELYGRENASSYFRERYFHQPSPARLVIHESAFHAIGDAVWYQYEFTIDSARGRLRGRGVAMCKKTAGRWRIATMHHLEVQFEPNAASGAGR